MRTAIKKNNEDHEEVGEVSIADKPRSERPSTSVNPDNRTGVFLPKGETINSDVYIETFKKLKAKIQRIRPNLDMENVLL